MSDALDAASQTIDTDAPGDGDAGQGCASVDAQARMLARLAEAGLQIAIAIEQRVKAAGPAEPLAELNAAAQAYARVARAVRLCVLLQDALAKGRTDPDAARRREQAGRAVAIVKRVARDHCDHDPFSVSAITREAAERLDTDDVYGLVASRPLGELVALVCRDLGLDPDWGALAQEAWAQAEAQGGAEGSPFAPSAFPPHVAEDGGGGPAAAGSGGVPPPPSGPPFGRAPTFVGASPA